jgi:hypothetical protein
MLPVKEKVFEYKKIKSRGAYIHLIRVKGAQHWKFHRYDGPAIDPISKDSEFKKSYYLNGIQYSKDIYDDLMHQREGIPFYKTTKYKARN